MAMEYLLDDICNLENLQNAWDKVRINMGSPGVDKVSVEDFESNLSANLEQLQSQLKDDSYHPLPLLKINVKKDDGGKRTLCIPTVRDRIVQEAFLLILQPIFDEDFLNCSYGYRPGMSAFKAIKRVERNIKKGKIWVVDADIKTFFDTVDRDLLLELFSQKVSDIKILRAVKECVITDSEKGIPQGSPISPLLSNIYLHQLDAKMIKEPWNYVRFADDFVVLCGSKEEAEKAMNMARQVIQSDLHLSINESKTRICSAHDGFVFLGYRFTDTGKAPAGKAVENLKLKVQKEILTSKSKPESELNSKLKSIIRGWQNYFKLESQDKAELMSQLESIIESQGDSVPVHVLKAALCIEAGEQDKAVEAISHASGMTSEDPELLYQQGVLYEELNMPAQARDEYSSALRISPEHKWAAYGLGLSHLQEGDVEKSIRLLQKAIRLDPNFAEAHLALGTALQSWGLEGVARKAFKRAKELRPELEIPKPSIEVEEPKEPPTHTADDMQLFLRLFAGREGIHAEQWANSDGRNGYTPVSMPLSASDIEAHLAGEKTLGLYMMRTDDTVKLGVIDVDITKAVIREIGTDQEKFAEWHKIVEQDINRLVQVFQRVNIPVYVEVSGRKGRHCWIFFKEPIRAIQVRKFLMNVSKATGRQAAGLHREIFPKQNRLAKDGLGCIIKLPLGIHRLTERRCFFLDKSGKPYKEQFGLLKQINTVSRAELKDASIKLQLGEKAGIQKNIDDTQVKTLMEKCNVIRYLAKKAKDSGDLSHYERLVILCTLGHLGAAGHHYVHQIIGHCSNYDQRVTEKWIRRLKPFPMSCPKIREILCDVTPSIGCYCKFPRRPKTYPNPILHIDPDYIVKLKAEEKKKAPTKDVNKEKKIMQKETKMEIAKTSKAMPPEPKTENPSIDSLLKNYLELKRSWRDINVKMIEIEQQMKSAFEATGKEKIQTYLGQLVKTEKDSQTIWTIEI